MPIDRADVLGGLLVAWFKLDRRARRELTRLARAMGGIAWSITTPQQRTRLGLALHDALEHSRVHAQRGLFDWEVPWLEESLPQPPARVLVGAAGSGREVLALHGRGYEVEAFEPAPRAFTELRENARGRARVWRATYQEVARDGLAGRYDAVLLGWGSLACVVEEDERVRLLLALDRACPVGPILASFVRRHVQPPRPSRLSMLGAFRIPDDVLLLANAGYMRPLDRDAVERLGQVMDRRAIFHDAIGQAYVTWVR